MPLHPALTDVPVGAWTSAFVLDLVAAATGSGTAEKAADGALAVGVAGALPAAATGTADWRDLIGEERRIATVHALLKRRGAGPARLVACAARPRKPCRRACPQRRRPGDLGTAAQMGGELSFGLGVRVSHTFADAQPSEFVAVADETEVQGQDVKTVTVDGMKVLLARSQSGQLCAIANTCSHLGGPLGEGERDGDVITCPWHGSRFDLCNGAVIEGPAVFPQPGYEVRTNDGKIDCAARPTTEHHGHQPAPGRDDPERSPPAALTPRSSQWQVQPPRSGRSSPFDALGLLAAHATVEAGGDRRCRATGGARLSRPVES